MGRGIRDTLTVAYLKAQYLQGIDLTIDNGQPYPDSLFEAAIDAAIETIEAELNVVLSGLVKFENERHDRVDWDPETFHLKQLHNRPVREVTRLQLQAGSFPATDVPKEWAVVTNDVAGQVQILPGPQSFTSVSMAIPYLSPMGGLGYTPGWYVYDYKAGFDGVANIVRVADLGVDQSPPLVGKQKIRPSVAPAAGQQFTVTIAGTSKAGLAASEVLTWLAGDASTKTGAIDFDTVDTLTCVATAGTPEFYVEAIPTYPLPATALKAVSLTAALLALDTAGDLIAGAGIASVSTGIDGLSTSIGTTSSATNAGYGARIISYQKQLSDLLDGLRRKWRAVEFFAV